MKIVNVNEVAKTKVEMEGATKAWRQLLISSRDGSPSYAVRVFTVEPGGHTPYHAHAFEHLNYVISGEGCLVNEAGDQQPIGTGDFALVLPNEKHQYRNLSPDRDLVFICAVPKDYE